MQLSKQEMRQILHTWQQNESILMTVFNALLKDYTENQTRQDTEWETLRQSIEFTAKRQALIDFKNILSKRYDSTTGQ